jgi:hypothetical protein
VQSPIGSVYNGEQLESVAKTQKVVKMMVIHYAELFADILLAPRKGDAREETRLRYCRKVTKVPSELVETPVRGT